jgi:sigma-B regulation protein RsbU (phosphoserine phosphatase)
VLCTNIAGDKFVTLFYGVLDARGQTLRFTNAGHLRPVIVASDGGTARLEDGDALLGVFPEWQYTDSVVQISPGDVLALFTDGITEAANREQEEFGEDRLIQSLVSFRRLGSRKLQLQLLGQVKSFCNGALTDDATLIILTADSLVTEPIQQSLGHRQLSYSGVQND